MALKPTETKPDLDTRLLRAIAVANGHPEPDAYVERVLAADRGELEVEQPDEEASAE
jgi:hypothetical protein